MASFNLTALEARILGCLLEKERVTPENYPLSLHSVSAACNQSTNRDPITAYDEKAVNNGLDSLRQKKLATVVFGAGSRVQKYRHNLSDHFNLDPRETALLCVLLLRGPQTPGELRIRAERLQTFAHLEEVESCLTALSQDETKLIAVLPTRPGQKERRYTQLLSSEQTSDPPSLVGDQPATAATPEIYSEITDLRKELQQLRADFETFRKKFD